jgi:hypothetical protein
LHSLNAKSRTDRRQFLLHSYDGYGALDADGHVAVDRRSAEALFPQFAAPVR